MTFQIEFDTSEPRRLALDLTKAPERIQKAAPKVLEVGANKIKKGLKREARGHGHLPKLPVFVSYDRLSSTEYIIGFDKVGQGNLANIAAFGSINNAAVMDINAPLRKEAPFIAEKLATAGLNSVFGGAK